MTALSSHASKLLLLKDFFYYYFHVLQLTALTVRKPKRPDCWTGSDLHNQSNHVNNQWCISKCVPFVLPFHANQSHWYLKASQKMWKYHINFVSPIDVWQQLTKTGNKITEGFVCIFVNVCLCVDLYYHNVTKHQYEKYIYEILVKT